MVHLKVVKVANFVSVHFTAMKKVMTLGSKKISTYFITPSSITNIVTEDAKVHTKQKVLKRTMKVEGHLFLHGRSRIVSPKW